jgi:hypothetical protein
LHGIGLKINRIDDDPNLSEIVYRIQTVLRLLFSSTNVYKIFATSSQKIFKNAVSVGAPSMIPIAPPPVAEVAHLDVKCQKCGKTHSIYAKFVQNPKIDEDYKNKGATPFPKDNKLACDCGFEIDLSGIRNEIETQLGKKMV